MQDIAPLLLEKLNKYFDDKFIDDTELNELYSIISKHLGTYEHANKFATRLGDLLVETFEKNISVDDLPDGKMYFNIATRTVQPMLEKNYSIVSEVCNEVQNDLNTKANIGIKAIKAPISNDRIQGFIDKLSNVDNFEEVEFMLNEPVVNFTQSIIDDFVKVNAKFHSDSGLKATVKRTVVGNCCEWCRNLEGTYDYEDVKETGNDVWRRHRFCRCTVDYVPTKILKRKL